VITVANQKPRLNSPAKPHLLGLHLLRNAVRDRQTGALGHHPCLVQLPLGDQPRHRLRQLPERQRQQGDQRQRPDQEQTAPADGIQQHDGQEGTDQAAHRHPAVADRAAQVLLPRRGDLRDQRAGGGDQRPHAQAGEKPENTERGGAVRERGDRHPDREPPVGGQHHPAATDDVTDSAGQQRTEQHPQQGITAQGPRHRGRDLTELARVLQKRRHHRAIGHQIIPVEHHPQGGQRNHPQHRSSAPGILLRGRGQSHL